MRTRWSSRPRRSSKSSSIRKFAQSIWLFVATKKPTSQVGFFYRLALTDRSERNPRVIRDDILLDPRENLVGGFALVREIIQPHHTRCWRISMLVVDERNPLALPFALVDP